MSQYAQSGRGPGRGSNITSSAGPGGRSSSNSHNGGNNGNSNSSNWNNWNNWSNRSNSTNTVGSPPSSTTYPIPTMSSSTHSSPRRPSLPLLPTPVPMSIPKMHTSTDNNNNNHGGPRCAVDYERGYANGIKYDKRAQSSQFYNNGGNNSGNNNNNINNNGNRVNQNQIEGVKQDAFAAGKLHGYQEGYKEGRREAYKEGRRVGHQEGHKEGHKEGRREGQREGQKEGHKEGFKEGHREGHQEGHQEGRREGYYEGYYQGHYRGEQDGLNQGYQEGYEHGFCWASTFWTSAPLHADVQEFVPGQYTGPLVVDGTSGPDVDPTSFRIWLNDVEYRKLTRPKQADTPSSHDALPPVDHQDVEQPNNYQVDQSVDHHFDQNVDQPAHENVKEPATDTADHIVDQCIENDDQLVEENAVAVEQVDDSADNLFVTPIENHVEESLDLEVDGGTNHPEETFEQALAQALDQTLDQKINDSVNQRVNTPPPTNVVVAPTTPKSPVPLLPRVVCLSRPVSPDSSESEATVIHNYTKDDKIAPIISFGEIPVTITRSPVRLPSIPASPSVTVEAPWTIIEDVSEIEEDCASDTATVGDHSTLLLDMSDDDTVGPVELPKPAAETTTALSSSPDTTSSNETDVGDRKKKGKKDQTKVSHKTPAKDKTTPHPTMKFEDIVIFRSNGPEPDLRNYPSALYQAQPMFEIGPDQAPQITESYPSFRTRSRKTVFSAYRLRLGQLRDPIAEVYEKDGIVFPVGGRTPPRGIAKLVPDHIVYKFGIPPPNFVSYGDPNDPSGEQHGNRPPIGAERLARCVQHGLSTCPMCAITPSFRFLGPGEALSRTLEYNGKPAGDPQTNPVAFWRFRPVGFSEFEVHGRPLQESSLAETQHPDEASPFFPVRMMPQYDAEVLGHHVRGEHAKEKPLAPSDLDTFCCEQCGGLTWLVTRRSRPNGGGPTGPGGTASTNGGGRTTGDRTFGKLHPSHHATFNEAWSRSQSFCSTMVDGGRGDNRFPEQSGTTRSLFVEVTAVPARAAKKGAVPRFGVAAFFGANSRHNSRLDLDLATATMEVAKDSPSGDGRIRLLDLPFESFTSNAGPIVAVAVALHRLWVDVVPAHRAAIDKVTRYNSDHSRRKAYRFRAIIMTDSKYVVDLFSEHLHKRWKRRFRPYKEADKTDQANGIPATGEKAGPATATDEPKSMKKNKPKKTKVKKENQKQKEEAEAAKAVVAAANGRGIRMTVVTEEYSDREEPGPKNKDTHTTFDELIDLDLATGASHRSFSVSTSTPTSSRSRSRSHSPPPSRTTPVIPLTQTHGLFAPLVDPVARDDLDFDRPDGRFVYANTSGGLRLANGVLVHLVRRYMELLRWHGVHVALYEVDGAYVQGARHLAAEAVE